jgi:exosortase
MKLAVPPIDPISAAENSAAGRSASQARIVAVGLLTLGVLGALWIYREPVFWLLGMWRGNSDYSHGFLIPLVSLWLCWIHRDRLVRLWPDPAPRLSLTLGVGMLLVGVAMRVLGMFTSILTLESISIVPFLFGVVVISAGWQVGKWAAPALLYLLFMVPLPQFVGGRLSGVLQMIATHSSVFSLQTLGVPAVAEGNIIYLTDGTIGVAEACSGVRMLGSFFALTVAACLVLQRTWVEKLVIVASAIPIAILANCLRITVTGLAYRHGDAELADRIFHDWAGWLMMPVAVLMLVVVLEVLDRLIVVDDRQPIPA